MRVLSLLSVLFLVACSADRVPGGGGDVSTTDGGSATEADSGAAWFTAHRCDHVKPGQLGIPWVDAGDCVPTLIDPAEVCDQDAGYYPACSVWNHGHGTSDGCGGFYYDCTCGTCSPDAGNCGGSASDMCK